MFTSKTLLFLTLLVALFVASSAQSCSLFANCDDCVGEGSGNCGWCESTSECLAGNSVGPGGVAANCTEWFYDNCLAVDCYRFTSCSTCLRDPFCGWCQSTSSCVEGLRTGPVTGTCNTYIFDRSSCPATSTTGRRTTTSSSTSGRRTTTTGRRATSASTTGSSVSTTGSSSASTTGSSVSTTGSSSVSTTGGSSSSTGRRATGSSSSTGRRSSSSSTGGRRATSTSGRRATSSTGRQSSSSGRRASSSTGGASSTVSTTSASTISSSTTGQASSGAAYSINSVSLLVAIGVVVIALVNLLF